MTRTDKAGSQQVLRWQRLPYAVPGTLCYFFVNNVGFTIHLTPPLTHRNCPPPHPRDIRSLSPIKFEEYPENILLVLQITFKLTLC